MPSASAFLDETDAPSASAFLDEEPEVTATQSEGEDGFLAKINAALRKPSPAWLQAPESAARELVTEMVPHDLPSYLKSILGPAGTAFETGQALAQGDVSGIPLVGRVPEIMAADETPAFSKERYKTALKTLMDVGALAGAVEAPRVPLRAEPTLAERITQPRVEPAPVEPPPVPLEPEIPATAPEAVVPGPVAEAAPPTQIAPLVSPRAAKQLAELKRHKAKVEEIGGTVSDDVNRKIAEIEGVPPEAPLAPEMMMPEQADTYFRKEGLRGYRVMEEHKKAIQSAIDEGRSYNQEAANFHRLGVPPEGPVQAPGGVPVAEPAPTLRYHDAHGAEDAILGSGEIQMRSGFGVGEPFTLPKRDGLLFTYEEAVSPNQHATDYGSGVSEYATRPLKLTDPKTDILYRSSTGETVSVKAEWESGVRSQEELIQAGKQKLSGMPEPYTHEAAATRAAEPVTEPAPATVGEPTALKNAITAAEREARGLSPREQVEERSWEQAKAIAEQEAITDSGKGARIVKELNTKPRPLDDIEGAHLLRRKVEVQKEHDAAVKAVNENPGNESMVSRLDEATEELQATYEAAETSGTAWGRGGAIRQALMAEDFSLANMKAVARAKINKGEKLSPEQIKNVEALHERLATAEDKVASFEARDAFNEALKQARPQTRTPGGLQGFLDQQAVRARERIVARRGRLYADPTGATQVAHLVDEAIIGASHIARGVTKFADWSGAMIREFGENIKPFLKDLYARSKEMANRTAKGKLTPEERETRGLAADIKRIVAGTETYRARTEARDVSPLRPKREPRMNKEKTDALFEREEAKKDYKEMLLVEQLKQQTALQKTGRYAAEALRSVRSVKFSFDISGLMQQGAFESFGHPIAQARRLKPMFEALASERGQFRVMQELRDMPEWKNGEFKQAGVEFADIDTANLNKREEIFSSRIAGKVPGVKMSERAFVTLLNQIRAQRYVALRDSLFKGGIFRRGGELTLAEKQILGNFVNVSTGRGNLWKFKQATGFLNAIFSAPRLRVSNFQLLFGQPIWHKLGSGSWRVRQLMLKEYAQTAAGVGLAVYAVSQIPGVEVETDRRSTNYGQIRIGDLRINPFSRLQSIFVLLSRIQTGETKTQGGKIVPNRGKVPYGGDTGLDLSMRYLRSGATPNIAATINSIVGSTVTGEPTTAIKEIVGAPLPLSINGLSDALKAEGVPAQTAAGIASFIGLGVGHFGHKTGKQKDIERRRLEERDEALLSGDFPRAYELSFRYPEEG